MMEWEALTVERIRRTEPGLMLVRLHGALVGTREAYDFLGEVQRAAEKGRIRLVIDLTDVSHVGSAGIGILAACYTSVTGRGGRVCLFGVRPREHVLLDIVQLSHVIESAGTEEAAVLRVMQ